MRPMRMRIAHELVTAYDLLPKMEVSVGWHASASCAHCSLVDDAQMPARATAQSMTAFHTDEYIDFLSRVTPETFDELSFKGSRCECEHTADVMQV